MCHIWMYWASIFDGFFFRQSKTMVIDMLDIDQKKKIDFFFVKRQSPTKKSKIYYIHLTAKQNLNEIQIWKWSNFDRYPIAIDFFFLVCLFVWHINFNWHVLMSPFWFFLVIRKLKKNLFFGHPSFPSFFSKNFFSHFSISVPFFYVVVVHILNEFHWVNNL